MIGMFAVSCGRFLVIMSMLAMSGCASIYKETGDAFGKGQVEASKIVTANLDAQKKARRMLAIRQYIDKGYRNENITRNQPESFARYACAGEGDYYFQRSGLGVLNSYKSMIAEITKSPDENIGALWKSIQKNRESRAPLTRPAEEKSALAQCTKLVTELLRDGGMDLAPLRPEVVSGAIVELDGLKSLVDAIEKVVIAGFRIVDEAARARALREFVKQNEGLIDSVLNKDLSDEALESAYRRRLRASLVLAYEELRTLYRLDPKTQPDQIARVGQRTHEALGEFDTLRIEASPQEVAKVMREAQKKLIALANGEISAKEAWAALKSFADMLKNMNDAVDDAKKQLKNT